MAMSRLSYVDTAKFIAIYFVIISHCSMSSNIAHFLFAFHVPMFFFLYGYVRKKRENLTINDYLYGGGKILIFRVLIPYMLLSFILGDALHVKTLTAVCYGSIQTLATATSTHLWFLPCYFLSVLLYNMVEIKFGSRKFIFPIIILLFAIISAIFNYDKSFDFCIANYVIHFTGGTKPIGRDLYIGMPWGINVAFSGIVLIYAGTIFRRVYESYITSAKYLKVYILNFLAIIGGIAYHYNDGNNRLLAMSLAIYGNYLLFLITAITLSCTVLLLSTYIDNPIFSKYGKYTFPIYAFHLSFVFIGNMIYNSLPRMISDNCELKGVFVGTITLFISCLFIPIVQKIDSNLIGEHK